MTTTTEEKIAIMQAFIDDPQSVEMRDSRSNWRPMIRANPTWSWGFTDYRIRPMPRRVWVNEYPSGSTRAHLTEESAKTCAAYDATSTAVEYVELTDEIRKLLEGEL